MVCRLIVAKAGMAKKKKNEKEKQLAFEDEKQVKHDFMKKMSSMSDESTRAETMTTATEDLVADWGDEPWMVDPDPDDDVPLTQMMSNMDQGGDEVDAQTDEAKKLLEDVVPKEDLTKENIDKLDEKLMKIAEESTIKMKDAKMPDADVEDVLIDKKQKKQWALLKKAVDRGALEPTSYLMQKFRDDLKSKDGDTQYRQMGRLDAAKFRLDWAENEKAVMKKEVEKTHMKSWQKVDTTRGKYKMLGQIIMNDGGFNDKDAVEGWSEIA